jgi:hypothetical protein
VTTKHRFHNNKYRLQIREHDHNPAHAHLVGGKYDVIIQLETLRAEGEWPKGLRDEVLSWIRKNQMALMEEWHRWHR